MTYLMTDEYTVPVEDSTFDVVLSGQVIEHVRQPWTWMRELARICKPGGCVITIAPASWVYHEAPIDCFRFFPEAFNGLSADAGLLVEFVRCESLEAAPKRNFPGVSSVLTGGRFTAKTRVKMALGWPTPRAYDTICVARKR